MGKKLKFWKFGDGFFSCEEEEETMKISAKIERER